MKCLKCIRRNRLLCAHLCKCGNKLDVRTPRKLCYTCKPYGGKRHRDAKKNTHCACGNRLPYYEREKCWSCLPRLRKKPSKYRPYVPRPAFRKGIVCASCGSAVEKGLHKLCRSCAAKWKPLQKSEYQKQRKSRASKAKIPKNPVTQAEWEKVLKAHGLGMYRGASRMMYEHRWKPGQSPLSINWEERKGNHRKQGAE